MQPLYRSQNFYPLDVCKVIMDFVPKKDRHTVAQVCRAWHRYVSERLVIIETPKIKFPELYDSLKDLTLRNTMTDLDVSSLSLTNLRKLTIPFKQSRCLVEILQRSTMKNLQFLYLHDGNLTINQGITDILKTDRFSGLHIDCCYTYPSQYLPQVKRIAHAYVPSVSDLTFLGLESLSLPSVILSVASLAHLTNLTNLEALSLKPSNPEIKLISLVTLKIKNLADEILLPTLQHCPSLRNLLRFPDYVREWGFSSIKRAPPLSLETFAALSKLPSYQIKNSVLIGNDPVEVYLPGPMFLNLLDSTFSLMSNEYGNCYFDFPSEVERLAALKVVLENGIDLNLPIPNGAHPVWFEALSHALSDETIDCLFTYGKIRFQATDQEGKNAFFYVNDLSYWWVPRLKDKGVDINGQDHYKNTPLAHAFMHRNMKTARTLLANGASPVTFALAAMINPTPQLLEEGLKLLKEHGVDLASLTDSEGKNILDYAIINHALLLARISLPKGLPISRNSRLLLMVPANELLLDAYLKFNPTVTQEMMEDGAKIGNASTMITLLEHGGQPSQALCHLAHRHRNPLVAQVLFEAMLKNDSLTG